VLWLQAEFPAFTVQTPIVKQSCLESGVGNQQETHQHYSPTLWPLYVLYPVLAVQACQVQLRHSKNLTDLSLAKAYFPDVDRGGWPDLRRSGRRRGEEAQAQ